MSGIDFDFKSEKQGEEERRHVLILGSGFGGIEVLKRLQKEFCNGKNNVDITLVSRDNFLLFTPMLPEVSTGRIETRHIVTPVRSFISDKGKGKNVRFHEANVESIDLGRKQVIISHNIGDPTIPMRCNINSDIEQRQQLHRWQQQQQEQGQEPRVVSQMQLQKQQSDRHKHTLNYDYLVIALGSDTNFFGIDSIKKHAFTMEEIDDAIAIRNHVLEMLEQADLEKANTELRKSLLTFVIVGGGFNGIETVGELNDFVRETVREF
ncbi:MAG: NAD(P)/FAD-dependent oxidoreductase, partial [Nitrososphaeraceae archaeon]